MSLSVYGADGSYRGKTVPLGQVPRRNNGMSNPYAQQPYGSANYGGGAQYQPYSPQATSPAAVPQGFDPGKAQPIQPAQNGNRLGESAPSVDDLLQEAVDTLGNSPKASATQQVAPGDQRGWRWDGNQNVYTTDEEEQARQRELALRELEKQRQDRELRRPNPYRTQVRY